MRRALPVLLVAVCLLANSAARAEDPLQFFEQLMKPPATAVEHALRPAAKLQKPATTTDLLSVPMPRLRPGDADDATLGYAPESGLEAAPLVPRAPPPSPAIVLPSPKGPPPAAGSACGAVLAQLGVEATPLAPVEEGACIIPAPVSIDALDNGSIAVAPEALLDCDFAEALAEWVDSTLQPIALKTFGHKVTGLRIAASYACRNRDGLADAKLSEHARGNAIDISAFRVDGIGWIDVENGWKDGGANADFLRQVRASACGPFTTVLGPGSDTFHSTHFHLDRAQRRTAGPSRGLFCQ